MKAAIVVLSDPSGRSEEALGRLFNALAATYDFKQRGEEVTLLFQGAGTRWPAELGKPGHPASALYEAVEDKVAGVSCACADAFGATDGAKEAGLNLIGDNLAPGSSGLPSLARLSAEGYSVLVF